MLVTELFNGQGLGNQLWCYAVTRALAKRLGYQFGIMTTEKYKAKDFLQIDFGEKVIGGIGPEGGPPNQLPEGINNYYKEKYSYIGVDDVTCVDRSLFSIKDNTKIDGNLQSEKYFHGMEDDVKSWFKLKTDRFIEVEENICVIHIRGGDFIYTPMVLDRNYYVNAIKHMSSFNSNLKFVIITDDINYAKQLLPEHWIRCVGGCLDNRDNSQASHHRGGTVWKDYAIMNNAKYLILSASSFGWWATWTNLHVKKVIAPMYWAGYRNSNGYWSTGDIMTKGWLYVDRDNNIQTYD